ncbi:MAG: hypothetical protein QOJ07_1100, partial [Thermoleophilaceae bacterium]|nr:hypothetical protein [Thermoleophilaceae bacterium]
MRAAYANCFLPEGSAPELLVTDEVAVAAAAPGAESVIADARIGGDDAYAADVWAWRTAFDWFAGDDPSVVVGISAADIAGSQVALALLIPALRGVLEARAAPPGIDALDLWVPGDESPRFRAVEELQGEAFAAALGDGVDVTRHVSRDPRNAAIARKYEQTRDPEWLTPEPRAARAQAIAAGAVLSARGRLTGRRRDALLVYEYNPTNAFAQRYAERPRAERRFALARCQTPRPQLAQIPLAGDTLVVP